MAIIFSNKLGRSYEADSLKLIQSKHFLKRYEGKINLIFTSPPFSIIKKKEYGNEYGQAYIDWLVQFAKPLSNLLTDDGSIAIEIGNSWEKGAPIFSTIPIEALLAFKKEANLHLCQEFICNNPSRLPSPAQWVTITRERVKDSYTRIWWLSKSPYPKADNKNILREYSNSMLSKLKNKNINLGKRPSGHSITESFYKENRGSISPNFLEFNDSRFLFDKMQNALSISNASNQSEYNEFCLSNNLSRHPARMQLQLVEYFVRFLTDENDIVFDPFAGSNTTGMISNQLKRRWVSSEMNLDYIKGSLIRFYNGDKAAHKIAKMAGTSVCEMVG